MYFVVIFRLESGLLVLFTVVRVLLLMLLIVWRRKTMKVSWVVGLTRTGVKGATCLLTLCRRCR